jgi:hypothetical protein
VGALDDHVAGAVPASLEDHFRFFKDPPTGDRVRYHLYCYFHGSGPGSSGGKYHQEWFISDTEAAVAGAQALEAERRQINVELFRRDIIDKLRAENTCLLERGTVLVKAPAMPSIS